MSAYRPRRCLRLRRCLRGSTVSSGLAVFGYKIAMLNRGESPLKGEEPGLEELLGTVVRAQKFPCTSDFSLIAGLDAVTLSIQTPFLNKDDLLPDFLPCLKGYEMWAVTFRPACW